MSLPRHILEKPSSPIHHLSHSLEFHGETNITPSLFSSFLFPFSHVAILESRFNSERALWALAAFLFRWTTHADAAYSIDQSRPFVQHRMRYRLSRFAPAMLTKECDVAYRFAHASLSYLIAWIATKPPTSPATVSLSRARPWRLIRLHASDKLQAQKRSSMGPLMPCGFPYPASMDSQVFVEPFRRAKGGIATITIHPNNTVVLEDRYCYEERRKMKDF